MVGRFPPDARHRSERTPQLDYDWQLTRRLLPHFAQMRLSEIHIAAVAGYRRAELVEAERIEAAAAEGKPLTYTCTDKHGHSYTRKWVPLAPSSRTTIMRLAQILEVAVGTRPGCASTARRSRTPACATWTFARVLRDMLAEHKATAASAGLETGPKALVFPSTTGTPLDHTCLNKRIMQRVIKEANRQLVADGDVPLPGRQTPRSLRRTFSVLYALGEDPGYVMEQMGTPTRTWRSRSTGRRCAEGRRTRRSAKP